MLGEVSVNWSAVEKLVMFGLLTLTLGCGSARYIYRDASNGIIAVPRKSDRAEAEELMRRHFPDGYIIERENEVIAKNVAKYSSKESSRCTSTRAMNETENLIFYRSQTAPAMDENASREGKQLWDKRYYIEQRQLRSAFDALEKELR